jgi:serine/threonine protein kinase
MLCDFAIAEVKSNDYTAPEIVLNNAEYSTMTDIWSIGALAYFLLNGTPSKDLFIKEYKESMEEKKSNEYIIKRDISSN